MTMIPIPAGSIFTISTGEYSDYSVHGVFRALKNIDAESLRDAWLDAHPDQTADYHFEHDEFLGWVTQQGYLETVDSFEWHLCDYLRVSEMDVTKI